MFSLFKLLSSSTWINIIYISSMAIYFKSMLLNLEKHVAVIHTSFRVCQGIEWDTGVTCASFNKVGSVMMDQWVKALVLLPHLAT